MADLLILNKTRPEFNETYLRRMAITNFGAGHETTCSALTASIAMIGSHAVTQERVAEEVRQSSMEYDSLRWLPYTMASIKEAQRLYPAVSMPLSRKVPAGGMHAHGHSLPPGTIVGCNPVALHRNIEIFGADAEVFNPERWLTDNAAARRNMNRYNLTYGGGNRTCPGRHLAEMIVGKTIPALVRNFDIRVTMPSEDEIDFYFMAMLTGVKARFVTKLI